MDAGTASQLIPGVGRTDQRGTRLRFILYDVRDHSRQLTTDATEWRATLAVLYQADVLTKDQANRLMWLLGGEGTSVGENEAKLIGDYLTTYLLPQVRRGEPVAVDPRDFEFEEVTDGTMQLGISSVGYAAGLSTQWLTALAQLCARSGGLGAISESARVAWPGREPDRAAESE
jgi:hypothetical protein